jgi:hypothetical protein
MKKIFKIDLSIYETMHVLHVIEEFKHIATISLVGDELSITSLDETDTQEIFVEFMNYILQYSQVSYDFRGFSLEDMENIDTSEVGFFRYKKFDTFTYLITNDLGHYHFLSYDSFSLLIQ